MEHFERLIRLVTESQIGKDAETKRIVDGMFYDGSDEWDVQPSQRKQKVSEWKQELAKHEKLYEQCDESEPLKRARHLLMIRKYELALHRLLNEEYKGSRTEFAKFYNRSTVSRHKARIENKTYIAPTEQGLFEPTADGDKHPASSQVAGHDYYWLKRYERIVVKILHKTAGKSGDNISQIDTKTTSVKLEDETTKSRLNLMEVPAVEGNRRLLSVVLEEVNEMIAAYKQFSILKGAGNTSSTWIGSKLLPRSSNDVASSTASSGKSSHVSTLGAQQYSIPKTQPLPKQYSAPTQLTSIPTMPELRPVSAPQPNILPSIETDFDQLPALSTQTYPQELPLAAKKEPTDQVIVESPLSKLLFDDNTDSPHNPASPPSTKSSHPSEYSLSKFEFRLGPTCPSPALNSPLPIDKSSISTAIFTPKIAATPNKTREDEENYYGAEPKSATQGSSKTLLSAETLKRENDSLKRGFQELQSVAETILEQNKCTVLCEEADEGHCVHWAVKKVARKIIGVKKDVYGST